MKRSKYNKKIQMQNKAKKIIASVLIFLLIGLPLKPLLANGEEIVNIGENTVLTADINGRVVITANNITLDCNGHKIIGSDDEYSRGIYLGYRNNITIKNCIIEKFGVGIYLISSSDNIFEKNNISSNIGTGISLSYSNNNSFINNDISNNQYSGIQLSDSNYNNINNNKIFYNSLGNGIFLFNSSHNEIFENNISENGGGISIFYMTAYSENLVYHNNFIGNVSQAYLEPNDRNDLFDNGYPNGGNYWSDYSGEDFKKGENQNENGSDGIGDIPYIFPKENTNPYIGSQDNYPFIEENGWQKEDVPEWRKNIQPGDILYDAGALPIKRRGIILYSIGHIGMYVGDGKTVEADKKFEDGGRGVQYRNIEEWDYPNKKLVYLLRVNANNEEKERAVTFIKTQADAHKSYDPFWIQKNPDPNSPSWYCSELVWAAYYNQGINLENGEEPFDNPVAPKEIYHNSDTLVVAEHLNYLSYYAEEFNKSFSLRIFSPVNVEITDPDGNIMSKEIDGIDDAVYIIDDLDDDGDYEDTIGIATRKIGQYIIKITPKVGALYDDVYTLKVNAGDAEIILADNLSIGELIESGGEKFFYLNSNPKDINGKPVDKNAPQGFYDEETALGNTYTASILDFNLTSLDDFFPALAPNATSTRNISVINDGLLGFQYTARTKNATGTLCSFLDITNSITGETQNLIDFISATTTLSNPQDDWNFSASLNSDDPALQNQTCVFDLTFLGWQNNIENYGDGGFSDEETISNFITAGEWISNDLPPDDPLPQNGDVIINEIMWMGTSTSTLDEWLELKNTTDFPIDIGQWKIENARSSGNSLMIPANKIIPANGYFLIANYPETSANSALNVAVNQVNASISLANDYSTNGFLVLKDATDNIIDSTSSTTDSLWSAGENGSIKKSMERNNDPASGWHTCDTSYMTPEEIILMKSYWKTDAQDYNCGTPGNDNLSLNDPSAENYQNSQEFFTDVQDNAFSNIANESGNSYEGAASGEIASVVPLLRNDTIDVTTDELIENISTPGDIIFSEPEPVIEEQLVIIPANNIPKENFNNGANNNFPEENIILVESAEIITIAE